MRGPDTIVHCSRLVAPINLTDIPSPVTYPPPPTYKPLGKIVLGILCTYNSFSYRFEVFKIIFYIDSLS